jgi:hypothetical protein
LQTGDQIDSLPQGARRLVRLLASVDAPVLFRKVTLQVSAILKDAADIDHIQTLAKAVEDEMARIMYDAERSLAS